MAGSGRSNNNGSQGRSGGIMSLAQWEELSKVAVGGYVHTLKEVHRQHMSDKDNRIDQLQNQLLKEQQFKTTEDDYERKRNVCTNTIFEQRIEIKKLNAKVRKLQADIRKSKRLSLTE